MEGKSGEQAVGELDSVTSSAGCFVQGWQNETGNIYRPDIGLLWIRIQIRADWWTLDAISNFRHIEVP